MWQRDVLLREYSLSAAAEQLACAIGIREDATEMSVEVGERGCGCRCRCRERCDDGWALLDGEVFQWTGRAVTGERGGMSVDSWKGMKMMSIENSLSKGALSLLYSQPE